MTDAKRPIESPRRQAHQTFRLVWRGGSGQVIRQLNQVTEESLPEALATAHFPLEELETPSGVLWLTIEIEEDEGLIRN